MDQLQQDKRTSKITGTTLGEGIVIRYTSSGIRETRSLTTIQPQGSATRVMMANIGGRIFLLLPDTPQVGHRVESGTPQVFSEFMREQIARRDLGYCRVCGDQSDQFHIRHLGPAAKGDFAYSAFLVCGACDTGCKYAEVIPVDLGSIRESERSWRISQSIPLTLNAKTVLTGERLKKRTVQSKLDAANPKPWNDDQKREGRRIREAAMQMLAENEYTQKGLAIAKAKVRYERERQSRESVASMCGPVKLYTLDGRHITILPAYTAAELALIVKDRETITTALRVKIAKRDRGICRYCLTWDDEFEIDHVIPVAAGGHTTISNLVLACKDCNRSKGASTDYVKWAKKPLSEINKIAHHLTDGKIKYPSVSRRRK